MGHVLIAVLDHADLERVRVCARLLAFGTALRRSIGCAFAAVYLAHC